MNKWFVLGVVVVAASLGWRAGLTSGEAERDAFVAFLPEEQAYWEMRLAQLGETGEQGRICNLIFDMVEDYNGEVLMLDAVAMSELYDEMDRDRD